MKWKKKIKGNKKKKSSDINYKHELIGYNNVVVDSHSSFTEAKSVTGLSTQRKQFDDQGLKINTFTFGPFKQVVYIIRGFS